MHLTEQALEAWRAVRPSFFLPEHQIGTHRRGEDPCLTRLLQIIKFLLSDEIISHKRAVAEPNGMALRMGDGVARKYLPFRCYFVMLTCPGARAGDVCICYGEERSRCN